MKAKLLLDTHQEFAGAQISWETEMLAVETLH
jgi:hypothetical protein